MDYNLGKCVGYKTDMFTWKAYILDMNSSNNTYLIEYQDFAKTYKIWVHKDSLVNWKK